MINLTGKLLSSRRLRNSLIVISLLFLPSTLHAQVIIQPQPNLNNITGVLPVANGGTGLSSYTIGDLIYASATTTLSKLADVATGNALISGGVGANPSYGKIGLTTHVSGILPVANGGTNKASWTQGVIPCLSATTTFAEIASAAAGQVLVSGGSGSCGSFSASPSINSTLLVGITGTPLTALEVTDTSTSSPRGITNSQYSDSTDSARFNFYKARGTRASPTTIVTGDVIGNLAGWGYDGSNFLNTASIRFTSTGTIASTRVPTQIEFYTGTDAAPSVLTNALIIDKAQRLVLPGSCIDGKTAGTITLYAANCSTLATTFAGAGNFRIDGSAFTAVMTLQNATTASALVGVELDFNGTSNGANGIRIGAIWSAWDGAASTDGYLALGTRTSNSLTEKWRVTSTGVFLAVGAYNITTTGNASFVGYTEGYVAKTGTYTITSADSTVNCTSGTFTVTLPTAVGITGRNFTVKNSGAGTITLATTSAQTIDGASTQTLTTLQSMTVVSDGANWIIK